MKEFLQRISSRKFLTALFAEIAGVIALCWPAHESQAVEAATRVAALATMLLAALGYGVIEGAVDKARAANGQAAAPAEAG